MLQESGDSNTFNYVFGFDGLFVKSAFIELNNEVFNALVNTFLTVKIFSNNDTAAASAAPIADKGKKGAAPVSEVKVEPIIEIRIPFYLFAFATGGILDVNVPFSQFGDLSLPLPICAASVDLQQSQFNLKIIADTCIGEYLLGSRVVSWSGAIFQGFPASWTLHAPDVVDPKAKVPPTAAELRSKYFENISKNLQNQGKLAAYTATVGGTGNITEEESDTTVAQLQQLFPAVSLSNGKIEFDEHKGKEIPVEEDIRNRTDLWKGNFFLFALVSFKDSLF
jgi:hypothetical protein